MKKLKEEYERLVKSKEFKHRGFLSSMFIMAEPENLEIFKEEKTKVKELNLDEVKISINEALEITNEILERNKEAIEESWKYHFKWCDEIKNPNDKK